jgi:hypothetical protein
MPRKCTCVSIDIFGKKNRVDRVHSRIWVKLASDPSSLKIDLANFLININSFTRDIENFRTSTTVDRHLKSSENCNAIKEVVLQRDLNITINTKPF